MWTIGCSGQQAVSLSEVEPVWLFVKRSKAGAMSFGLLLEEAHETMLMLMNRLGARSNSGEGGENRNRSVVGADGVYRNSKM